MKNVLIAATLALACGPLWAQETKELTRQQTRMVECNQKAADLKGDERKAFMGNCLRKQ